jgi:hypothetical protein
MAPIVASKRLAVERTHTPCAVGRLSDGARL